MKFAVFEYQVLSIGLWILVNEVNELQYFVVIYVFLIRNYEFSDTTYNND